MIPRMQQETFLDFMMNYWWNIANKGSTPVTMSASQRCPRWWLWGSELRGRSHSLGPKWWAALTSRPKLLWVRRTAQNKHSGASRASSVRPSAASRCWWRPCLRWGLSADGPLATSTPLRTKWQQLWPREVRVSFCALVRARVQGSACLVGFSTCRFSLSLRPRSAVSGLCLTGH